MHRSNATPGAGYLWLACAAGVVLVAGLLVLEPRARDQAPDRAARGAQDRRSAELPWGGQLFAQFYIGARALVADDDPYHPTLSPTERRRFASLEGIFLNHPPTSLLPYLPLSALSFSTAASVQVGISALLLTLACWLWGRALRRSPAWGARVAAGLWVGWVPAWRLLAVGQNTAWALLALSGWLHAAQAPRRRGLAGALLACSLVKPHLAALPCAFALGSMVRNRDLRALAAWGGTTVIGCALVTAIAPRSWSQFLDHLATAGPWRAYFSGSLASRTAFVLGEQARLLAYGLFAAALLVATIVGWTRARGDRDLVRDSMLALAASTCLVPHAYDYDMVLLLPAGIVLLGELLERITFARLLPLVGWLLLVDLPLLHHHRTVSAGESRLWWIAWLTLAGLALHSFVQARRGVLADPER